MNQFNAHSQASGDSVIEEIKDETGMYIALAQAKSRLLMVCFTARWCRPCHEFQPKIEQIAKRYSQVVFVKVDVDKLSDLANEYGVRILPTFMLFKGGFRVGSVSATMANKIEELLMQHGAYPIHG